VYVFLDQRIVYVVFVRVLDTKAICCLL